MGLQAEGLAGGGLLVDTNLLVLYTVGAVNRNRIENFKRTSKYTRSDYDLLREFLDKFNPIYAVPHVLAEVSNLTDLSGAERQQARLILKQTISKLVEETVPSAAAAADASYDRLGLVDAAIGVGARICKCAVLTDDLALYVHLLNNGIDAINFAHLQARRYGI